MLDLKLDLMLDLKKFTHIILCHGLCLVYKEFIIKRTGERHILNILYNVMRLYSLWQMQIPFVSWSMIFLHIISARN